MRWSCPHCGVGLAISDEKIGSGWSFSRCYKCAGHALVRRAEINLIKVDKAPPGERILLPEATEEPLMSQNAAENYQRVVANPQPVQPPQFTHPIPEPLPERSFGAVTVPPRVLPVAMGIAGALAMGSGIYLYVQGMNLWNKARQQVAAAPSVVQTDHVQSSAMAPSRSMRVQSRAAGTPVYSGPGTDFSTIGVMDLKKAYRVSEWNERWFKVDLDGAIGWVRNDLVQSVTASP